MTNLGSFQVPSLAEESILKVISENFGIETNGLKRLESYDDLTYQIKVVNLVGTNKFLGEVWPHGYIFKVTNPEHSENENLIDGQICLMNHIRSNDINCPESVRTIDGTYWRKVRFTYLDDQNNLKEIWLIVRMMKFLPGHLLCTVPAAVTEKLFFDLGQLTAKFHLATQSFHHEVFDSHKHLWSLSSAPAARKFAYVFPVEEDRKLALETLEKFEKVVLAKEHLLTKGQIHGDLNEHNLLVEESNEDPSGYRLSGVIDFGDTQYSCLIYDLTLAIVYMMVENSCLPIWEVGGHVLAGYCSLKALPEKDVHVLPLCMAARLAQSLIIGYYTYQSNPVPENQYVLYTQRKGWPVLKEIRSKSEVEVLEIWNAVQNSYARSEDC